MTGKSYCRYGACNRPFTKREAAFCSTRCILKDYIIASHGIESVEKLFEVILELFRKEIDNEIFSMDYESLIIKRKDIQRGDDPTDLIPLEESQKDRIIIYLKPRVEDEERPSKEIEVKYQKLKGKFLLLDQEHQELKRNYQSMISVFSGYRER